MDEKFFALNVPTLPSAALRPSARAPGGALPAKDVEPAEPPTPYEAFYGLTERAFSLSSDPRFVYHSRAHDRTAQELLGAIWRHDRVVVVTGERGSGKTILCRSVMEQLDQRTLTTLVTDSELTVEGLLNQVLRDFGVAARDDLERGRLANASAATLLTELQHFLGSLEWLQAFAVVMVDDAQAVSPHLMEHIRLLTQVGESTGRGLLQVVLIGEPPLLSLRGSAALRPFGLHASVRTSLDRLAREEIAPYIQHRLAAAGPSARVSFSDAAAARVFDLTGGLPAAVNVLCDRALAVACQEMAGGVDELHVVRAAAESRLVASDTTPAPSPAAGRSVMAFGVLLLMVAAGAALAGIVFQARVAAVATEWIGTPEPPPRPRPALPRPIASPQPPAL